MASPDWERGDLLGIEFPVRVEALRAAGPEYLTRAFRAAGSMGADNSVVEVTRLDPFRGGSTGCKALLSVSYERPDPTLPEELFVKFSRDLDDELRDRGKAQMESEVRFGLLSRIPDFPVAVPQCLFGDYHAESSSGLLISKRIAFGTDGLEPHHPKARDYELDEQRAHYDVLVAALARLAGSHRAGRFPDDVMAHFEPGSTGSSAPRRRYDADQIRRRVDRYADFATRFPQLLPASVRSDEFIAELRQQAPRAVEHADALRAAVRDGSQDLFAFCHWNANIDNAWFWREENGDLACGLMDWGNVGQMSVVTALSSCLVFAEPDFQVRNLRHFLTLFADEFEQAGGGPLDAGLLERQFALHMVAGAIDWPLDAVPLIERHVPDLASVRDRFDPRIADDEFPRTQLHLLTARLMLWQASDPRRLIDWAIARAEGEPGRRSHAAPAWRGVTTMS